MSSIHVKPAPGRIIRAPDGSIIPPEGQHLVQDLYLQRRIAEGDLVVVEPEATEAVQQPEPAMPAQVAPATRKKGPDA